MAQQIDDFAKLMIERVTDSITDYNSKVEASQSIDSIETFQEHFLKTAPELANFNSEIETVESHLESLLTRRLAAAMPLIQPAYDAAVKDSGIDLVALDEQLKMIRSVLKVLKDNYVEDAIKQIPEVAKKKGGSSTGTGVGTGTRRIRGFNVYIDGVIATTKHPKTGKPVSTFSAASTALDADNTELQNAFLEAAGREDWNKPGFPAMVDFEFAGKQIKVMKQGDSSEEDSDEESEATPASA